MAAVGHVVALDTGTHFAPHPGQRLFFDDAARCLHVVEGRLISACLLPGAPGPAAEPPAAPAGDGNGSSDGEADSEAGSTDSGRAFLVSSGPPVALLRAAPGVGVTALQRSARVLELTDHLTGNLFVASPTDARGRHGADLLGFFWTSAEDLVLVTAHGLEAYALQPSRQGLRREWAQAVADVRWYTYCHEARIALLGFGANAAKAQPFLFQGSCPLGVLRLPLLDLAPPWVSSPIKVQLLGTGRAGPRLASPEAATASPPLRRGAPRPLLASAGSVWVVTLYGQVYCAHHDRRAGVLRLYRMFRDASGLAHEIPVPGDRVQLSVVDSVLCVHLTSSHVVALYDPAALPASGGEPVCSPLPLVLPWAAVAPPPPEGAPGGRARVAAPPLPVSTSPPLPGGEPAMPWRGVEQPALASPGQPADAHQGLLSQVQLFLPDWAVDAERGTVSRLRLDLQAIAEAVPCLADAVAFLQRRAPSHAERCDPHRITLHLLTAAMERQLPLSALRCALDECSRALTRASGADVPQAPRRAPTPQDVCGRVLRPLQAQRSVPPAYLQAALSEYLASCQAWGVPWPAELGVLYLDLLVAQGRAHLVGPLLRTHAGLCRLPVAERLEGLWREGALPQGLDLALRVYRLVGAYPQLCLGLVRQQRLAEAAHVAKRYMLTHPELADVLRNALQLLLGEGALAPGGGEAGAVTRAAPLVQHPLLRDAVRALLGGSLSAAPQQASLAAASLSSGDA